MGRRRVVLTGLGVVSSIGQGAREFFHALLSRRSGIRRIQGIEVADMPCQIAGQVLDFDPSRWMDKKQQRRLDRYCQLAVAASDMAVADSGLDLPKLDPERVGVVLGTGIGGITEIEEQSFKLYEKGPDRVSPFFIPKMMANAVSGELSIRYGIHGPNFVTVSACASAGHAIASAMRTLQHDPDVDVVISGGSEAAVTRLGLAGFCSMRALSKRNDEPARASRPFDRDRDGFVMGEGAGILVLEELEHARRRGARIYAELLGAGWSADGHHITSPAPDGKGAAGAMTRAMREAGLGPTDVDYVNAHGTATEDGDKMETRAIHLAFGERAKKVPVSSTKSMIGHLLGAAGGVELIATVLSVSENRIHPTLNLENADPDCDLDHVPGDARETEVRAALSNSFGFGGHNLSILVGKFDL